MTKNEIKKKLKKTLSPQRYQHTLNVVDSAIELGKRYGGNINEIELAALLHDCAKDYSSQELKNIAKEADLELDAITYSEPQLLHGPVGGYIAKRDYGVTNQEILNAIIFHTTGRENMTHLEKIIYLADFIEVGRDYPGVNDLRKLSKQDLDLAIIQALTNTIKYICLLNGMIHIRTVSARNELLLKNLKSN